MWNPAVPGMEDAHICAVLSFRRIRRYPVLLNITGTFTPLVRIEETIVPD